MFDAHTEGENNSHPGRALANETREKTVTGIEIAESFFIQNKRDESRFGDRAGGAARPAVKAHSLYRFK
ncbi:MAG: hypothetical protein KAR37_11115 [Alphaproteobacteria bacterium]|jgi:hypothetical protein|nr:hypothetical protein [Alphaproteobacteria bacterium]